MSIASSLSRPSERRLSIAVESFRTFSPKYSSHSENRMRKPGLRKSDDVATAISPSGWVAAASPKQIRLYNLKEAKSDKDVPTRAVFNTPSLAKEENIRAIAISEDLLAVVTHRRLLVCEGYQTSDELARCLLHDWIIDQNQGWTPNALAISQVGTGKGATASVAVGGEGYRGLKIFKYVYTTGWNAVDDRLVLECPENNGAIKLVGIAPYRSNAMYGPMVFAQTTRNRIYCWTISQGPRSGVRNVYPSWHIDCNRNTKERAYGDEISLATLIISPTGRPYIFWTADHKPGSHLPPSFLVPVDLLETDPNALRNRMRHLPEGVMSENVLVATSSPNGQFLVVVERGGAMKLLTLQGAHGGGLTCAAHVQTWKTELKAVGTDTSKISIYIEEHYGALEIIAVDGKGRVVTARVNVPDMPAGQVPNVISAWSPPVFELEYHELRPELSSEDGNRYSMAAVDQATDYREIVPS